MIASGTSMARIEREMKALGYPIKRETIGSHLKVCMNGNPEAGPDIRQVVEKLSSGDPTVRADFATLVQRRAINLMDEGILRINTRDGLQAQQIIDKRLEKAEDRRFSLNMARLLAGGGQAAPVALIEDGNTVEGDFTEVDETLYAPEALRDPV